MPYMVVNAGIMEKTFFRQQKGLAAPLTGE
jgi:hypothetical protein